MNFKWRMLAAAGAIIAVFAGLIVYTMRVAPRMDADSKIVLNQFYLKSKAHDYHAARALFSQQLRATVSESALRTKWQQFEAKHGPIKAWKPADLPIKGFSGSVCVFPPFVDSRDGVSGAKGSGTLIYVRMVPEAGTWRLDRLSFLR